MDIAEEIKSSVTIEQVVHILGGLELKKTGRSFTGECPTGHSSESGRCFSVNYNENYFYCFHCNTGGDIYKLVMLVKRFEFKDALLFLAENFRPDLISSIQKHEYKESPEKKEYFQKAALYDLVFEYGKKLLFEPIASEPLSYLIHERGYKRENIQKTEWIYFSKDREIRDYLLSIQPDAANEIENISLQGAFGDNFRLAFPYRDRFGKITGFLKRSNEPKGINVRDIKNVRYDSTKGLKKDDLFNLSNCRGKKTLIIVEGCPDAMYLPTLGLSNVAAVSQGLLSKNHIEGLQSFHVQNLILSFDNDPVNAEGKITGVENTEKAIETLSNTDIRVFVIDPPLLAPHKDPDEYVKYEGIDAFYNLVKHAQNASKWKAKRIVQKYDINTDFGKSEALHEAIAYEETLQDPLDSKYFLDEITANLGISYEVIEPRIKDFHEKKELERVKREYKALLDTGKRLLDTGNVEELSTFLAEEQKRIQAKTIRKELITPYSLSCLTEDIQNSKEGLQTGYESLDKIIKIPQEAITIIAGRPSHGKTTFLLNLFLNMVKIYKDYSFFFFSYEETRKKIALKIVNILGQEIIDNTQNLSQIEYYLKGGHTNREGVENGKHIFEKLTESGRMWIIDEPYYVDHLVSTLAYLNEKYRVGAIFIDYIQKVKIRDRFSTRQLEIQKISEKILEASKELSLPIILGAQLNREVKSINDIDEGRLREAGDIEQDANLVIGLWNEARNKQEQERQGINPKELIDITLLVLKNRDGIAPAKVTLKFERPTLNIMEIREEKNNSHRGW